MSIAQQHKDLHSYAKHIEQNGPDVPTKIMGVRRSNSYISHSMLYDMWTRISNPDEQNPFTTIEAEFGEIRSRGSFLHADKTYSKISAPSKGANIFQGDIVEIDSSAERYPKHRYSIILMSLNFGLITVQAFEFIFRFKGKRVCRLIAKIN